MSKKKEPVAKIKRVEKQILAQIAPTYRLAHSAVLEGDNCSALCSVLMSMTHALSDLLMPVCEYPCLIQKVLPSGSPAQDLAKRIAAASDRLCVINQHLIRLCHGNEGLPLDVDMGLLTQEVLADLAPLGENVSTVRTSLETDSQPALLNGPPDALYHLVRDMCLNAFSSLEDGGHLTIRVGTVTVRSGDVAHRLGVPELEYLGMQFLDDGPGIDSCCRETLFDPFVSTASGEGFGLGLSSVYRTVRHFNGMVLYNPDDVSGADFILLFPKAMP